MKIIITGASGSIGQALVPYLNEQGHDLLLVGRSLSILQERFPDHECCIYSDLVSYAVGFDACVHLAVMNNDTRGNIEDFRSANVQSLMHTFRSAEILGCRHFINLTSFHAKDLNRNDPYAVSKREADLWLAKQDGIITTNIVLPAVYSQLATGNLAKVNKLPRLIQPVALSALSAIKLVVSIERVTEAISVAIQNGNGGEIAIVDPAERNLFFSIYKKFIDWSFALSIVLLAWWLLLAVFVCVKFSSKGAAIFAQERVGQYGDKFICYKFRTMRHGTKQAGTHDIGADAITGIGRFLRKTKLDELPQVINIFQGKLSLVGPRPCLPTQTVLIEERVKRGVDQILPGITGWAQINNIDMSDPVKLAEADSDYAARRSIPFELSIILRTLLGAGRGDRVKLNA